MYELLSYIKKDLSTAIVHIETFEAGSIKCAIVITKLAWYCCRVYCSYPLKVHKNSPLYRAMKREKFVPWSYSYKTKEEDSFIFERVIQKRRSQHLTLEGSLDKAKEFEEECKSGVFELDSEYPENYKYFSQFGIPEKNAMETEFEAVVGSSPSKFEVNKTTLIDQNEADRLINTEFFRNRTIVKTMRINDILSLNYFGVPSIFIYSRTFYYAEAFPYTDGNGAVTSHNNHIYTYDKAFCCYVKRADEKLDLIRIATELDIPFLNYFVNKQWERIFEPRAFYDIFTTKITHKRTWNNMQPDELNETLQVGSILRIPRKNGVYFHAGVYLGWDLVIHVKMQKKKLARKNELFAFDTFEKFIKQDTELEEIRLLVPRFTKNELYERALKMNREESVYQLIDNNCEHLACLLTTGIKFSFQLVNPIKKFVAKIIGDGLQASTSPDR